MLRNRLRVPPQLSTFLNTTPVKTQATFIQPHFVKTNRPRQHNSSPFVTARTMSSHKNLPPEAANFDVEQISYFLDRKLEIKEDHQQYLRNHPELQSIIQDFLAAMLIEKPEDVFTFARDYFENILPASSTGPKVRPLLVAGPSGAGKGTLIAKLQKAFPDAFGFSVSHTTRKPRPGEENGVHYHFAEKSAMETEIADGKFIEHANVHGNLYGTSVQAVEDVASKGKVCILDIDIQGMLQVKKTDLNPHYVFISPPSIEALEDRLKKRGTETEQTLKTRLANAAGEMEYRDKPGMFEQVVINDDLEVAFQQLKSAVVGWYPDLKEEGVEEE